MSLTSDLIKAATGKKLLIFDFDGTIAETSHLHAQAFAETLAPFGISFCYQHIAGMRTSEALLSCFDQAGLEQPTSGELELLVTEKQNRVRELIGTSLEPLDGMDAFLHWAKTRFKMALVTSGSRVTVSLALDKLGYNTFFQTQIFAEDVKSGKPDPEGFLLALNESNCKPEHALIFEDSIAGFKAAAKANIEYVNVSLDSTTLIWP